MSLSVLVTFLVFFFSFFHHNLTFIYFLFCHICMNTWCLFFVCLTTLLCICPSGWLTCLCVIVPAFFIYLFLAYNLILSVSLLHTAIFAKTKQWSLRVNKCKHRCCTDESSQWRTCTSTQQANRRGHLLLWKYLDAFVPECPCISPSEVWTQAKWGTHPPTPIRSPLFNSSMPWQDTGWLLSQQ